MTNKHNFFFKITTNVTWNTNCCLLERERGTSDVINNGKIESAYVDNDISIYFVQLIYIYIFETDHYFLK